MPILELAEPIPVMTELGEGRAIIFESGEHDNFWTVILESGALVTLDQRRVRAHDSYTHYRGIDAKAMRKHVARKKLTR